MTVAVCACVCTFSLAACLLALLCSLRGNSRKVKVAVYCAPRIAWIGSVICTNVWGTGMCLYRFTWSDFVVLEYCEF